MVSETSVQILPLPLLGFATSEAQCDLFEPHCFDLQSVGSYGGSLRRDELTRLPVVAEGSVLPSETGFPASCSDRTMFMLLGALGLEPSQFPPPSGCLLLTIPACRILW